MREISTSLFSLFAMNKSIRFFLSACLIIMLLPLAASSQSKASAKPAIRLSPDTACNGMAIDHKSSVIRQVGNTAWKHAITNTTQYPRLILRSADNKQQLELIQHYGNPDYNVSEFKLSYVDSKDTSTRYIKTNFTSFESGKKIKLGMTVAQVQQIWGSNGQLLRSNSKSIVQYRIKSGSYLQRHSKTLYYATYTFQNDKLISFSYGFDYE